MGAEVRNEMATPGASYAKLGDQHNEPSGRGLIVFR